MASTERAKYQFTLRRLLAVTGAIGVVLGLLVGAARAWYWWTYPYGWSHCCDQALYLSLLNYAQSNGGTFPAGGATPEGSLCLLYPQLADANLLRGKTVPLAAAQAALDRNGQLDATTCDWHYVEGLTTADDPRLALFWDKVGLGHNGQRLSGGGHVVIFCTGERQHIAENQWEKFLSEQKELLGHRSLKTATPSAPQ